MKYSSQDFDINPDLGKAHNLFAFDLFQAIAQTEQDNVFISPYSVALALAMTYNGADHETRDQMAKTLRLDHLTLGEVNRSHEVLMDVLMHLDKKVQLSIANSLWARQGKQFKDVFLQTNRNHYNATIETLDFGAPGAVRTINKWVDKQTKGKITEIVEGPIDPHTILFLINAIYFNGAWQEK